MANKYLSGGTKKVVINSCFGGFGLSCKAEALYASKSGFELYFYTSDGYGDNATNTKVAAEHTGMFVHSLKVDFGDKFIGRDREMNDAYWSSRDIARDDPILVQVVEELGKEANGSCAALRIVEVPSDVEWEIDEYDGQEHIAEVHRTWC